MKTSWFVRTLVCVFVSFLLFASNASGDLIAYVAWSRDSSSGHYSEIQQIDLDTGAITNVGSLYVQMYLKLGISPLDNNLYGMASGTYKGAWDIDPITGLISSVWGPGNCGVVAFAPDGTLYTHAGARQKMASWDLVNQTGGAFGNALPQVFPMVCGLAINSHEQAIAGDNQKKIYSVDLSNGNFTTLGTVAGLPFSLRGLDYDGSDRLIAFFDTGIYSIDVSHMSATMLMPLTPPETGYQGQSIAIVNVPEPGTLILLVTALTTGVLFRRRKQ